MCASDDGKTKSALLLSLDESVGDWGTWGGRWLLLAFDASELLGIGKNKVHVLRSTLV